MSNRIRRIATGLGLAGRPTADDIDQGVVELQAPVVVPGHAVDHVD